MRFKGFQPGKEKGSYLPIFSKPPVAFGGISWLQKVQTPPQPLALYDPDLSAISPSRAGVEVKARWVARKADVKVTSAPDVRASSRCLTRASRVPARSLLEERGGGVGAWGRQRKVTDPFSNLASKSLRDIPDLGDGPGLLN